MTTFLLDTDWVIDLLKGVPSAQEQIAEFTLEGASLSVITLGELYDGAFGNSDPARRISTIHTLVEELEILPVDDLVAIEFGQERQRLRSQGNLIPDMDLLIAATALANDLTLVTRNVRHFNRVSGLHLYWNGGGA